MEKMWEGEWGKNWEIGKWKNGKMENKCFNLKTIVISILIIEVNNSMSTIQI